MNAFAELFARDELPSVLRFIRDTLHKDVAVTVNWPSLAYDCEPTRYDEYWKKLFFSPLKRALLDVCRDNEGRQALANVLSGIVVQNEKNLVNSRGWCWFENGVVTLDQTISPSLDDIDERAQRLVQVLERASAT